jgi:hypothetical protein
MFEGCTNLKEIKCLNEGTIYARFQWWVEDIATSGTFIKSKNFDGWSIGADGIPDGWTVTNTD